MRPDGLRSGAAVARDWVRALENTARLATPGNTLAAVVAAVAADRGDEPALIGEHEQFSYRDLTARANHYAHWAADQGIAPGAVVALLMPNRPEYIAIWLGLTQAGCVVALLNTNLAGDALGHCIAAAEARIVIVDQALAGRHVAVPGVRWLQHPVAMVAVQAPAPRESPDERALLIYTSGTTGLPKAAHVSHARVLEWSGWFAGMMDAQAADRLYDCLPLYHSTGGVVAVGAMLVSGGSVVIREAFSASRFWADVADTGCTLFQYIGELCRYLLNTPASPDEARHQLRLCCGNGLSGEVWPAFQARFAIPRILEFYAATEGSLSLYNCEGKPGAIGRVPGFLAHRSPLALLRCDADTGEPVRDASGRCTVCEIGEPGEAVAQLVAGRRFEGYTDPAASAAKLLHDVLAPGDTWFRTGDLLRQDAAGFYAFVDRLGDTFRWKGENVATTEVAAIVLACPGVADAVVFGVAVPGAEGKAGMAAIVPGEGFDLAVLHAHLAALPGYARPLFVRLCQTLAMTGTFKLSKAELAREGYAGGQGVVWFNDHAAGRFVPLDHVRERLAAGVPSRIPMLASTPPPSAFLQGEGEEWPS